MPEQRHTAKLSSAHHWEISYAITRAFGESADDSPPIAAILQLLTDRLNWDVGALWVVNDQRLVLECVEFYSPEESSVENFATVPRARRLCIGEGLPGTVCATRQVTELPSPFVRKGLGKGEPIRYLGRHENKDRRQTNRRYGT